MVKKIFIAFMSFALIGIAFIVIKKQNINPPNRISSSASPTATIIYNTYNNSTFDFSLNYPVGWEVKEVGKEANPYVGKIVMRPITDNALINSTDELGIIMIEINNSGAPLAERLKEICNAYGCNASQAEDIQIDNEPAKKIVTKGIIYPSIYAVYKKTNLIKNEALPFKDYDFIFSVRIDEPDPNLFTVAVEERMRIFEDIIESFTIGNKG